MSRKKKLKALAEIDAQSKGTRVLLQSTWECTLGKTEENKKKEHEYLFHQPRLRRNCTAQTWHDDAIVMFCAISNFIVMTGIYSAFSISYSLKCNSHASLVLYNLICSNGTSTMIFDLLSSCAAFTILIPFSSN